MRRTLIVLAFGTVGLGLFCSGLLLGNALGHASKATGAPLLPPDQAVTLLAGQVRQSDGMTLAEWQARRLARVAHVSVTGYLPLFIGCGDKAAWEVEAKVTPFAAPAERTFIYTRTELGVITADARVLDVPQEPAWVRSGQACELLRTDHQASSTERTWLDDFRAGDAP
jgi:hypothetical protein